MLAVAPDRPGCSHRPNLPGPSLPVAEKKPPPPLAALGRRAKQRVARGKEPIDGRLDLHGHTQRETLATLCASCTQRARAAPGLFWSSQGKVVSARASVGSQAAGSAVVGLAGISRVGRWIRGRAHQPRGRGRALCSRPAQQPDQRINRLRSAFFARSPICFCTYWASI